MDDQITQVDIVRHGKVVETFGKGTPTEMGNAAWQRLMRLQPMSTDWAVRYEGWDIVNVWASGKRTRLDGLPKH